MNAYQINPMLEIHSKWAYERNKRSLVAARVALLDMKLNVLNQQIRALK